MGNNKLITITVRLKISGEVIHSFWWITGLEGAV